MPPQQLCGFFYVRMPDLKFRLHLARAFIYCTKIRQDGREVHIWLHSAGGIHVAGWSGRVCSHHSTHISLYYNSYGGADRKLILLIECGFHFTETVLFTWIHF